MGQILPWQQENGNIHDPYAGAVVKGGAIAGLVPQAVCYAFLPKDGAGARTGVLLVEVHILKATWSLKCSACPSQHVVHWPHQLLHTRPRPLNFAFVDS